MTSGRGAVAAVPEPARMPVSETAQVPRFESPAARLAFEVALVAGRLAALVRNAIDHDISSRGLEGSLALLDQTYAAVADGLPIDVWTSDLRHRQPDDPQPLDRLADVFGLAPAEVDLIVLCGFGEEHEGFSSLLRALHPADEPWPTVGLAARLMGAEGESRHALRELLHTGPAVRAGILRIDSDLPFFARSVRLADNLWPALAGIDVLPGGLERDQTPTVLPGLERWLESPSVHRAMALLRAGRRCAIVMQGDCGEDGTAGRRAVALAVHAGVAALPVALPVNVPVNVPSEGSGTPSVLSLLAIHAALRGAVPILCAPLASSVTEGARGDSPGAAAALSLRAFVGPVVVAGLGVELDADRPVLGVGLDRLAASDRRRMWQALLPSLASDEQAASDLAGRFPLSPEAAWAAANDLRLWSDATDEPPSRALLGASLRVRAAADNAGLGAVRRQQPRVDWDRLILPETSRSQLQGAVARLEHQAQVLDDWGFLADRHGARGVRMLLAGPPGTGKTLAAEVLATALGVDLLIVDLARMVSKWIGETEKNLAAVFDAAERASAMLLFDEADALFGRRTEISDSNDRYANLETAYLLSRLERFEGLAVLTTNLRQNIDPAFVRRLEIIVDFDEPNREARLALWRCHLPAGVPLAADVDLAQLAALYRLTGGLIKNASVSAAFLAATEVPVGTEAAITQHCFLRAIRREYEKAGLAFPGLPPSQPGY